MDEADELHTSVVNLYKLSYRVRQIRDEATVHDSISSISSHTQVHPVDREIALAAASLKVVHGYGAIGARTHAAATIHSLGILTGNLHFREFEGEILK